MAVSSTTGTAPQDKEREFSFNDEDFNSLRTLVRDVTGITLADSKRELAVAPPARARPAVLP